LLGPIVGHTDDISSVIWIRVNAEPYLFTLAVRRVGCFEFKPTEEVSEFGTAIATVTGLNPDTEYRYKIEYKSKEIKNSSGSFRTMPPVGSFSPVTFVTVSCNSENVVNTWYDLQSFINKSKPRFLVMMGDQVYLDSGEIDIWARYLNSKKKDRRLAMVGKYQKFWSAEPIRSIMKNLPTYMVWDDGDIRNGWGCYAIDSPTLATKYWKGKRIFDKAEAYFEDARDVYIHFQCSRNPHNEIPHDSLQLLNDPVGNIVCNQLKPEFGDRFAMPFHFTCGRLAIFVVDSRGARDLWRKDHPVLGSNQWEFLEKFLVSIGQDKNIDALAVITPTPIVATSPNGFQQGSLGHRYDDVGYFEDGDEDRALAILHRKGASYEILGLLVNRYIGTSLGSYGIDQIGDVRSQWSHSKSRYEQQKLIKLVSKYSHIHRSGNYQRKTVFIGGDLHIGGILDINDKSQNFSCECLVSSGIGNSVGSGYPSVPLFFDDSFSVGEGIQVRLKQIVPDFNFGVTQILFDYQNTQIINSIGHRGWASYWKVKFPSIHG
jgi:hypothetical protein